MKNITFTDSEVEKLLSFIGYGDLSAPIWFLGMEEAGGGEENLRYRLRFDSIEDLYLGHKKLGITKHHEDKRLIQPTWRGMCVIMLALRGIDVNREEIRNYQSQHLGRFGDETFLLELMPIPKPNVSAWGYEGFLPQFDDIDDYYKKILPQRIKIIKKLVDQFSPKVVIGYGKSYWNNYQRLFKGRKFNIDEPYMACAGKPFVILAPHFTSRLMNNRFKELADMIDLY